MQSIFIIVSILALQFHFYPTYGYRSIMIKHPDIKEYYLSTIKPDQTGLINYSRDLISNMDVVEKEELCKINLSVRFKTFQYVAEDDDLPQTASNSIDIFDSKQIVKLYNNNIMDDITYFSVTAEGIDDLQAIPCVMEEEVSALIANREDTPPYFILKKRRTENILQMAVLQPIPTLYHTPSSQVALETAFMRDYDNKERKNKKRVSYCTLKPYQKFQVCTAAYVAWDKKNGNDGALPPINYMKLQADSCIEQAVINIKTATLDAYEGASRSPSADVRLDLLPCVVNSNSAVQPQIFVAQDPLSKNGEGAYVLRQMNADSPKHSDSEHNEENVGKYTLMFRIEKLNVFVT